MPSAVTSGGRRVARRIAVVGLLGDEPVGDAARRAIAGADLVVGGHRHLGSLATGAPRTAAIEGDVGAVLDAVADEPGAVCVLASGDPGFFGIVRQLALRFGPAALDVHPAPSSVSLAFARLGLAWDDTAVVSAHGRPLADAARRAARCRKVAVLVSPTSPPEALGKELLALGAPFTSAAVCTRLGLDGERIDVVDLDGLAGGSWDPLSVVVLRVDDGVAPGPTLAWGVADDAFERRAGMITKAEVRAVSLGKLAVPPSGVLWDVGAGSGSVAIECASVAPGLQVIAVERAAEDASRIRANARAHGVDVEVVEGDAPAVLAGLPEPDRAFVGGGGLDVLDAVLARLRPGGVLVATYAAMDRAAAAAERLGSLVQVSVSRGRPLAGGWRLDAENPVFVVWGPQRSSAGPGAPLLPASRPPVLFESEDDR